MDVESWVEQRPDFIADLRFLLPEEGGRQEAPTQGYRCDFSYADDPSTQAWMIYPSFLDSDDRPLPRGSSVPLAVRARMRVLNEELRRTEHLKRLRPGVQFRLVEGARVVATGTVLTVSLKDL